MTFAAIIAVSAGFAAVMVPAFLVIRSLIVRAGSLDRQIERMHADADAASKRHLVEAVDASNRLEISERGVAALKAEIDSVRRSAAALAARAETAESQRDDLMRTIEGLPVSSLAVALRLELDRMRKLSQAVAAASAGDSPGGASGAVPDSAFHAPSGSSGVELR